MNIKNGPVLCPHCGGKSAYYEIDRLSAIRFTAADEEPCQEWRSVLLTYPKKAFCLMCHQQIPFQEEDKTISPAEYE